MFDWFLPIGLLAFGTLITAYREKSAIWFCRLGKATWSKATFGLTDMRFFYQEEQAKKMFRFAGPLTLCVGLVFACVTILSRSGPGAFCAMREAEIYLGAKYGGAETWDMSAGTAAADGSVDLDYHYNKRAGRLHGAWQKDHYIFVELPAK